VKNVLRHHLTTFMLVGSLMAIAPSAVSAQAQRVALSGTETILFVGEPAHVWTADGWTKFSGDVLTGPFAFSGTGVSLAGTVTRNDKAMLDSARDGRVEGTVTYVDANSGVACQGPSSGDLTNLGFVGNVNAPCSDGGLLQGDLQDTQLLYDSQGNVLGASGTFSGALLRRNG
jgi:hypothetical protein